MAQAQYYCLPAPGEMVHLSPPLDPPILKGIKVYSDNPFRFDFILDKGDLPSGHDRLKDESSKMIKYFLASLTIPEKDLWVNLSPYEKDRIIPNGFGLTQMGRDLLAEDYMLKQITASVIYPEDEIGKKFWRRVYEQAGKKFGTTDISVNTFNKVWIIPEKALVYTNAKAGTAFVVESKLKVMLEQDYLALGKKVNPSTFSHQPLTSILGSQIIRQIVIPELNREVNEGKNFAQLRQAYNSLILATWYKKTIKDSILRQMYEEKNKIQGLAIPVQAGIQKNNVEFIYQRYLQAFKKGVYNYIKEDINPITREAIPRKYFSGGVAWERFGDVSGKVLEFTGSFPGSAMIKNTRAMKVEADITPVGQNGFLGVHSRFVENQAMNTLPGDFLDKPFSEQKSILEQIQQTELTEKDSVLIEEQLIGLLRSISGQEKLILSDGLIKEYLKNAAKKYLDQVHSIPEQTMVIIQAGGYGDTFKY